MSAPNFNPPYWDADAPAPRFAMGKRVRVRDDAKTGHLRTPWCVRGRTGVVERICGHFPIPEELAYGRDGLPKRALYRVRFALSDIWPGEAGASYAEVDTLDVEIFEHWLEPFFDYGGDPAAEASKVEADLSHRS